MVAVRTYPLSLPFYIGRTLILSTDSGRELTSNYLIQNLELWRDAPGSPLRPGDWWREVALSCERPRVFVIRSTDGDARAFLAPRLPQLAETRKYAAYGPCGRSDLALQGGMTASSPPLCRYAVMPCGEEGG